MAPSDIAPTLVSTVVWAWQDRAGLDACTLSRTAEGGWRFEGDAVVDWDGQALALAYQVDCDAGFTVRAAEVRTVLAGVTRRLVMQHPPASGWQVDGAPRPDLAGAIDIDIMATPSTNTLPIRRLAWRPGQVRDLTMAYVRLPDLDVVAVSQRYTALPDGRYRYQLTPEAAGASPSAADAGASDEAAAGAPGYHRPAEGFQADLRVDGDGLVRAYPPYWRRRGAAN